MIRKRILICDDNPTQYKMLAEICTTRGYHPIRSPHCNVVCKDLLDNAPIQLLILDLGFVEGTFKGHEYIPEIVSQFPALKIIVYSRLKVLEDRTDETKAVYDEIMRYQGDVIQFLGPGDDGETVGKILDEALGTSEWLRDRDVWMLHVSDLQFGSDGLPGTPESLVSEINATIDSFVKATPHSEEPAPREYPLMSVITGDITQHGRPAEFELANEFLEKLASMIKDFRPKMNGVISKDGNVLCVPGNHDVNWDLSRIQNTYITPGTGKTSKSKLEYKDGIKQQQAELEFVRKYSWLPYCDLKLKIPDNPHEWHWHPGYAVVNKKTELGIIMVCLNSSRWTVDHLEQPARVRRETFLKIQRELEEMDQDRSAVRILLVHHAIGEARSNEHLFALEEASDEPKQLIDKISRNCGFNLILSGHIHELAARPIDTDDENKTLIHIGAGTARASDVKRYGRPEFNLVRLGNRSPDTNKYQQVTIFPFEWDSNFFVDCSGFGRGRNKFRTFDLLY